jgi:hypothetical protein
MFPNCGVQKGIRLLIVETDTPIDGIGRIAGNSELGHFQARELFTIINDFVGLGIGLVFHTGAQLIPIGFTNNAFILLPNLPKEKPPQISL